MKNWTIQTLYYGYTDGETAQGAECSIPWLGFYLTDGYYKILCDTGVKRGFFKDNKSPWGFYAEGDETHVLKALDEIGVGPKNIDIVVYTHFHWDHIGNCHLFPNAVHVFQDAEWKEIIDPLPSMQFLGMYDQRPVSEMKKLDCQRVVGDLTLVDGIELLHTPGHSAGHQSLRVSTNDGMYIIAGDLVCVYQMVYPELTTWHRLDGSAIEIDDDLRKFITSIFTTPICDHYAWFQSQYRIMGMIRKQEQLLPGHAPTLLHKSFG